MISTLLSFGWIGDFNKLRKQAEKHMIPKWIYKLYIKQHQSYIPLTASLGENIIFPHLSGIFIACWSRIGDNCTIYQQVTIGSNYLKGTSKSGVPCIGNNVVIGAGAKIIGGVSIGDNVNIGAGCVVVDDVPSNCTVVMNKPRLIIK